MYTNLNDLKGVWVGLDEDASPKEINVTGAYVRDDGEICVMMGDTGVTPLKAMRGVYTPPKTFDVA